MTAWTTPLGHLSGSAPCVGRVVKELLPVAGPENQRPWCVCQRTDDVRGLPISSPPICCQRHILLSARACRSLGAREMVAVNKGQSMSLGTILLIVLILMLIGVLPTWPHARSWGYAPSGIVGVIVVIVLVLFLMGRL